MSGIRVMLLIGGSALFIVLVVRIGPAAVIASFSDLSWRLLVILCFPFVLINTFDTLGWKFAFRRDAVPFSSLLAARLAGEAFNATTPTASVGGEAVKAWLIRRHVGLDEALPSVIVAKTTITIAQACFLLLGIVVAVAWPTLPAGSPLLRGMEVLLVLEVLAVGGFVFVQVSGVLGGGGRILTRLGLLSDGEPSQVIGRVDSALSRFYRQQPWRLTLSIACHFAGWVLSALEAYVILHALGLPVSPSTALLIEAFGTGIRFVSFMIPAHLGVLEGGHVAIFLALGLTAPAGLSFTLVRRVREAAWTGLGFIILTAVGAPTTAGVALEPKA